MAHKKTADPLWQRPAPGRIGALCAPEQSGETAGDVPAGAKRVAKVVRLWPGYALESSALPIFSKSWAKKYACFGILDMELIFL
ncbi:hypothetical protein EII18_00065 [Comamonadaceae bacterium OH3737_COT-264]|nr:hypothetical protein EII18_00065 [Comamonadaceae bacterium OH3737_COT-264]